MADPFEFLKPRKSPPKALRPWGEPPVPDVPKRSLWEVFARAPEPAGPLPEALQPKRGLPRRAVSKAFLEQKFDLDDLWRTIREVRANGEFLRDVEETRYGGDPPMLPLVEIAPEGPDQEYIAANFFGIPPRVIREAYDRGEDPWEDVILPHILGIEFSLNWLMLDEEFPGVLEFNFNDDDAFGLVYWERFED